MVRQIGRKVGYKGRWMDGKCWNAFLGQSGSQTTVESTQMCGKPCPVFKHFLLSCGALGIFLPLAQHQLMINFLSSRPKLICIHFPRIKEEPLQTYISLISKCSLEPCSPNLEERCCKTVKKKIAL